MDILRCVECSRTYYTPNARTLLQGEPRCSHCTGALVHEGEAGGIHVPKPDPDDVAEVQ